MHAISNIQQETAPLDEKAEPIHLVCGGLIKVTWGRKVQWGPPRGAADEAAAADLRLLHLLLQGGSSILLYASCRGVWGKHTW